MTRRVGALHGGGEVAIAQSCRVRVMVSRSVSRVRFTEALDAELRRTAAVTASEVGPPEHA